MSGEINELHYNPLNIFSVKIGLNQKQWAPLNKSSVGTETYVDSSIFSKNLTLIWMSHHLHVTVKEQLLCLLDMDFQRWFEDWWTAKMQSTPVCQHMPWTVDSRDKRTRILITWKSVIVNVASKQCLRWCLISSVPCFKATQNLNLSHSTDCIWMLKESWMMHKKLVWLVWFL